MNYHYVGGETKKLIGKTLESIIFEKVKSEYNDEQVTIKAEDGSTLVLGVEGDCCSSSWIEHFEGIDVKGATFLGLEELGGPDLTDDDVANPWSEGHGPGDENYYRCHECLQSYQAVIHTTKGDVSIEYRNSSNGYYGGSLCVITPVNDE